MYKIEVIKDFGTWAKKGEIIEVSNDRAIYMEKKGAAKILKYLGNFHDSPYFLKRSIESMENQITAMLKKIRDYEDRLKELENAEKKPCDYLHESRVRGEDNEQICVTE